LLHVLTTNFAFWYTSRLLAKDLQLHYRTVDTCGKRSFTVIAEIIKQQQPDRSAGYSERSATGRLLLLPPASAIVCPPNLTLCDPRLLLSDISRPICFLSFMERLKQDNLTMLWAIGLIVEGALQIL